MASTTTASKKSAGAAVHPLSKVITAHSFNWDRSQLAFCPNSEEVHIYSGCHSADSKDWKAYDNANPETSEDKGRPYYILKKTSEADGHTQTVTGIDWHPRTNKIVTCGHDRAAFVWVYNNEKDAWEPQQVVLGFKRGCVQVKWSPDGNKFAVAGVSRIRCVDGDVHSQSSHLAVCSFEESNNWWTSRQIKKKLKKTVLSIAWHPTGQILAAGSGTK